MDFDVTKKYFFKKLNAFQESTIKVCFDCQQNQPLPKMSVWEVFYLRQVWLYNLGMVQGGKNVMCCSLETIIITLLR